MEITIKLKHGTIITETVSGTLAEAQSRSLEIFNNGILYYDNETSANIYFAPRQVSYTKIK